MLLYAKLRSDLKDPIGEFNNEYDTSDWCVINFSAERVSDGGIDRRRWRVQRLCTADQPKSSAQAIDIFWTAMT